KGPVPFCPGILMIKGDSCGLGASCGFFPAMPTTFTVLGDGAWGTAIAVLLAQKPEHRVTLWSAFEENGRLLRERRENVRLLPGVPIPETVRLTADIVEAVDQADLWVAAIPTVYLRQTLQRMHQTLRQRLPSFACDR